MVTKTVQYHSGFTTPVLHYRLGAGAFQSQRMTCVGGGRHPGEKRWEARLDTPEGVTVQFYISDGEARDPKSRYYETALNFVVVQDGQLYDYVPVEKVSPASCCPVETLNSKVLGQNRSFRVYLPRGYYQHTEKNYPVLYVHDGQNIFEDGPFGCWHAQRVLDRVIARGQVRELIVVAINSGADRFKDYVPPEDGGRADLYGRFLVHELKPMIDRRFRTLPGRENTGILGSSLGGVVSLYMGWNFFHVFRQVAAMSGSWWLKNFRSRLLEDRKRPIRLYLDSGDSGHCNDGVRDTLEFKEGLVTSHNFELGEDFEHVLAANHEHNEAAWSSRLPGVLRFLFPAA